MTSLIIATRNAHKVQEIQAILGDSFRCLSLALFPDAPGVVEDAETFAGNATKKAVKIARWISTNPAARPLAVTTGSKCFVLADDSGLEVDVLNGAPGVHSARFAADSPANAGNTPDLANNTRLLKLLTGIPVPERAARFRCVIALTPLLEAATAEASGADLFRLLSEKTRLFQGTCEGRILAAPSGQGGFGYDPLFVPDGFQQSFAELGEEIKNGISHRARALAKLQKQMTGA